MTKRRSRRRSTVSTQSSRAPPKPSRPRSGPPRCRNETMNPPGNAASSAASLTTVLVDDVATMRELLRAVLLQDGRFNIVGEAADGVDAIRVVQETQPDLVVLDI